MEKIEIFGMYQPIATAPKDGTPFFGFVQKKIFSKGIYLLEFRGKTFRYHHTPSRIFEAAKYLKYWMPLPNDYNLMIHNAALRTVTDG